MTIVSLLKQMGAKSTARTISQALKSMPFLPVPEETDVDKVVVVNSEGTGYDLTNPAVSDAPPSASTI